MTEAQQPLSPFQVSILGHFAFALVVSVGILFFSNTTVKNLSTIKISVIEAPAKVEEPPQAISISAKPKLEVVKTTPPPVFGLSKNSLTSDGAGVQVKLGNTVAKEIDQIENDGKDQLPVPTAEYLISKMPQVLEEVRVPFPDEARKLGIKGAVIAELLIDSSGVVREAVLVRGLSPNLDALALDALKKFKFRPAYVGDQAVAMKIKYSYRFTLE